LLYFFKSKTEPSPKPKIKPAQKYRKIYFGGRIFRYLKIYTVLQLTRHALTHYRPAMPFGHRKIHFRGSFQFSIVTILKISPSVNLKFINLGIFQSLKFRILMGGKSFQFLLS